MQVAIESSVGRLFGVSIKFDCTANCRHLIGSCVGTVNAITKAESEIMMAEPVLGVYLEPQRKAYLLNSSGTTLFVYHAGKVCRPRLVTRIFFCSI